jgi:hypothetical protein
MVDNIIALQNGDARQLLENFMNEQVSAKTRNTAGWPTAVSQHASNLVRSIRLTEPFGFHPALQHMPWMQKAEEPRKLGLPSKEKPKYTPEQLRVLNVPESYTSAHIEELEERVCPEDGQPVKLALWPDFVCSNGHSINVNWLITKEEYERKTHPPKTLSEVGADALKDLEGL